MGIPDHLPCLLRNLYIGEEALVRTRCGKMDWFQIEKRVLSRLDIVTLHIVILLMKSTLCKIPGWMKHKLESRLPGEISITLDMQMTPH